MKRKKITFRVFFHLNDIRTETEYYVNVKRRVPGRLFLPLLSSLNIYIYIYLYKVKPLETQQFSRVSCQGFPASYSEFRQTLVWWILLLRRGNSIFTVSKAVSVSQTTFFSLKIRLLVKILMYFYWTCVISLKQDALLF